MKKASLFATAAGVALAIAGPARAQAGSSDAGASPAQVGSTNGREDQAIIVTARRRAEDVSKVPIAISAFSGEQLQERGISNTLDLVKITPGLNIQGAGGKTNPFIVIRGQSKAVTGNGSPGVLTYMNDVPLPIYGSLIQSYDMENIQVLKGPQGTLFGRNSIGGAVLTVTKTPTYNFEGYGLVDIGQYDNLNVEGAINVPIIEDKVAIRVATQFGRTNNNVDTYIYSPYSISNPSPGVYTATPGTLVPSKHDAEEFAPQSYR
ncbi:TonB-dependent receptor plug domain-containing protein, partial [Sphingobium sp.]|uniref:TonB-dependent receptor plug domain-containing protein n=1 Tax=Sphingobium sp. TaxID=1912891 RepID=UPI002B53AAAB